MVDVGVDRSLGAALELLGEVVRDLDVAALDAPTAAWVVEQCADAERLLGALRVRATATLKDKAIWRREGFRSAAGWMASKTGTAVGPAVAALELVEQLEHLPLLAEAFRTGQVSEAQAKEIAAVASEMPEAEEQLLEAASKLSLKGLREECRRVEATGPVDMEERHRRAHAARRLRAWTDHRGHGHLSMCLPQDHLARVLAKVDQRCDAIVVDAIRGAWFESYEAHRADALVDLICSSDESQGPSATVHVVVDYEALVRGDVGAGERCEIPGVGPIPVSLARQLADDAFLKVLVTKGVDIQAVAHGGRTIPAHLRTALEVRDPKCIVPRCEVRRGLEIDHRESFSRTRLTSLENTARLCRWHHYQKTFLGYSYRGGPGTWQWIPPDQRDEDLTALRDFLSSGRRRC
jgi:hypothetical protein